MSRVLGPFGSSERVEGDLDIGVDIANEGFYSRFSPAHDEVLGMRDARHTFRDVIELWSDVT